MNWKTLSTLEQLNQIIADSHTKPVGIFKHSTTCPISAMAKKKFEQQWSFDIDCYYLDLLALRPISNAIAETLEVTHQSPQFILIQNGEAVYHASHLNIEMSEIKAALENQAAQLG
jgi:bacillithiol system protein YtxJ